MLPASDGSAPDLAARVPSEAVKELRDGGITEGDFFRPTFACVMIAFKTVPIEWVHAFTRMQSPVNSASSLISYKGMEIGVARNLAVQELLATPPTHRPRFILWLSSDDLMPWDGLVRLWQYMENHPECQVITSIVHLKNKGHAPSPVLWRWDTDGRRPLLPGKDFKVGDIVEADVCNLGFGLMRTSLFEKIEPPWFKSGFETRRLPSGFDGITLQGEDCFFFEKLREKNIPIYVNTGVRSSHLDEATGEIY